MDSLWIATFIGVLIVGMYAVLKMLSSLMVTVVDLALAPLLRLLELFQLNAHFGERTANGWICSSSKSSTNGSIRSTSPD
jgi:hypothetical protein